MCAHYNVCMLYIYVYYVHVIYMHVYVYYTSNADKGVISKQKENKMVTDGYICQHKN